MSAKLNIIIYWISQDFQKNFDLYYKEYNFYNIKINVYCKKILQIQFQCPLSILLQLFLLS